MRNLERNVGAVMRKVVRQIAEQEASREQKTADQSPEQADATSPAAPVAPASSPVVVDQAFVRNALGRPRFYNEAQERIDQPGVATGLVWTPVGGDIVFVEATAVEGNRELKITGSSAT